MIVQPTADRPPALLELRDAVDRLAGAQHAGDGMARLEALDNVDELWAALRPGLALRAGAREAATVDDAVAELHLATDDDGRAGACNALQALLS